MQWGTYLSSIDILLFSVQRGINHNMDTIADSLHGILWGIAGCINEQCGERGSYRAVRNRSKSLVLRRVWVTKYILVIEKSRVLQYNGALLTVNRSAESYGFTIQRKKYGCCTVKQCKEPNDSL